ncbi:SDR family NAD(P)-dependent oxidoreductase [Novosphingobium sp. Gsoil 351]|uniref:SDR family NAD(P)-dependent oxidoreductase n=1 Tax=Novosphingobium sp. Gsoil 351 TaxID=2675225 RepID=UPI0012B4848D|nr:SDR family oxidoreductase [Novosphingobium sp. Gsoil 351]QGN54257.1 SDR family oxidoreductase [Novosphingobium sp. Gsoil 351]
MPDLSGKVAIVTGCASGIGAATVRRLRADGAQVLGTDLAKDAGRLLAEETGVSFAQQDVGERAAWPAIVAQALSSYGRLDILVNNAGMVGGSSIAETNDEAWDRVLAVNLTGTMAGCRAAISAMIANPGGATGSIINIGSTTALTPLPNDIAYSASKAAVLNMSKGIATWCARQGYAIRCNTVIPGATDTGILAKGDADMPGFKAVAARMSPMNRLADPTETAAAIAFLASDECRFMTGADLLVDGGALAIHPGL